MALPSKMLERTKFALFLLWLLALPFPIVCGAPIVCPQLCECSVQMPGIFVDCDERSLTMVPDVNVPRDARTFVLTYNQLTAVGDEAFSTLSRLITLRLQHNAISRLGPSAFFGLVSLRKLDLSYNRITHTTSIRDLPFLIYLELSSNFIQDITSTSFQNVADISDLHLKMSHNFMESLSSLSPSIRIINVIAGGLKHFDIHEIRHANRLRTIDLSDNNIRHLPDLANLTSLEFLILIRNPIHTISNPPPSSILKIIDLRDAKLMHLPDSWGYVGLTLLHLDGNRFESFQNVFPSKSSAVRNLLLSGNKIEDIDAIPYLPNLASLYVNDLAISGEVTLDMCVLPNIMYLHLSKNDISEFKITDRRDTTNCNTSNGMVPSSLSTLNLDQNRITTLAFLRHTPGLVNLRMAYNDIQRIDWEPADQHEELRSIDLSYNRLAVLENFTGMSVLQFLILSHNQIRTVVTGAFNGSFNVQYLQLDGNQLTEFPDLSALPQLRSLDLGFNSLKVVTENHFINLSFLTHLKLSSNKITNISLPADLTLHQLFLRNNALASVDRVRNAFTLDVSGNRITNVCSGFFDRRVMENLIIDDNRLTDLRLPLDVRQITCSNNRIKTFSVNFCSITESHDELMNIPCELSYVSLGWNDISYVGPGAMGGCAIWYLNLEGNPIVSFFVEYFPNLLMLSLSHTNVQNISLTAPNRTSIILWKIWLVNVTLFRLKPQTNASFFEPSLQMVTHLLLNDNDMVSIPTLKAPLLTNLNLSNNRIKSFSLETFLEIPRIRIIDLSKNSIRTIPCLSFVKAVHVVEINLENNRIDFIGHCAFINQSHFTLRLGNNQLMSLLPSSSLPLLSRNVYFDPNPWRCDCEAMALVGWLQRSGLQRVYCSSPTIFRNRSAVSLHPSELCPDDYSEESSGNGSDKNSLLLDHLPFPSDHDNSVGGHDKAEPMLSCRNYMVFHSGVFFLNTFILINAH